MEALRTLAFALTLLFAIAALLGSGACVLFAAWELLKLQLSIVVAVMLAIAVPTLIISAWVVRYVWRNAEWREPAQPTSAPNSLTESTLQD